MARDCLSVAGKHERAVMNGPEVSPDEARGVQFYSVLKTSTGSTRVTRNAGM